MEANEALATDLQMPADRSFRVIETVGWDGARFVRIWAHLARLERTCARFGIRFDRGEVLVWLDSFDLGAAAERVRVTVDRDGLVTASHALLGPSPAVWRVAVADVRVRADDPWLQVKTSQRALYDLARANLPVGVQEMIFLNQRGEVAEGAITSVFFDAGTGLCTPPLACGALPGVLRAEMIGQGCREAVLRAGDLGRVRLWVGNSLRGMIPVQVEEM